MSIQDQFAPLPASFDLPGLLDARAQAAAPMGETAGMRALDLTVAAILLLLLLPVLAAIAFAIRIETGGPALFRQTRLGRGGAPFRILKFRTMRVAEDGSDVVQATAGDARVTRIGAFLRAASLDELPQLINVVAGDMALVGPRPHAIAHDEYYAARIPHYLDRQSVKPGMTGWAQINGHRGPTPTVRDMQARIECDRWYARRASLALNISILARTPRAVLGGRNAL